jgi:type IV pilus assembly protein PilV
MRQPPRHLLNPAGRRRQGGVTLIDALIAIAILSFGLVGLSRMQGRMVASATDAQLRSTAVMMADELLNTVLVDNVNAACYTLPATGACASATATAAADDWNARLTTAVLPGLTTKTVTLDAATGRMTVSIGWKAHGLTDDRLLNVVTDVR